MPGGLAVVESAWGLPQALGLADDVERLRVFLAGWQEECDPEVAPIVRHQLSGRAKYFRPVTIFACHRALHPDPPDEALIRCAAALELTHNVSLIVDDILDRSRFRRQKLALHCRFGFLPALMTAGYMTSGATALVADDGYSVAKLAHLMQRLGAAECMQWRLRRRPLGVEDWRTIAGEDTGSMFETCACLGTRDDRLRRFGQLLGTLYHGCDDVADVRGTAALGGGSEKDILDGILTLPAAIAVRDPVVAALFERREPETIPLLTEKLASALPEAERYLDRIAGEAEAEARANAAHSEGLLELIHHTRALSAA
jgi:geranylgeranyl pyrophosphate synthase